VLEWSCSTAAIHLHRPRSGIYDVEGGRDVTWTELEVREGVGRRRRTSFNGDDLGKATEEVAPGETRDIWDIACVR